ncbi:MAG: hypothetical protein V7607_1203 [Solirubrobacteraceae bacterium]
MTDERAQLVVIVTEDGTTDLVPDEHHQDAHEHHEAPRLFTPAPAPMAGQLTFTPPREDHHR